MLKARCLGVAVVALLAMGATGCSSDESLVDGFTPAEWDKVQSLSPLPDTPPEDTTNRLADDPKAAALGQALFFDKSFSGPIGEANDGKNGGLGAAGERGKIACASCHQADAYMADKRSNPNNTALGAQWMIRNASTALNASYYKVWCEQDGIRDSQWSDSLTDPEDPTSMNGSRLLVAHRLFEKYKDEYDALFQPGLDPALDPKASDADRFPPEGKPKGAATDPDGPWEHMKPADQKIISRIYSNFGKAMQAYLRKLVSKNAAFDRYAAGDFGAIDDASKRGLKLYIEKANCIGCHSGPLFSDTKFHDNGLDQKGAHIIPTETGRYDGVTVVLGCEFNSKSEYSDDPNSDRLDGLVQHASDKGKWRTKQLRSISMTGPYMHTGQLETLEDVVKFYNDAGDDTGFVGTKDPLMKKLGLTDDEIKDLVAFLGTLTGDVVAPALVVDTSKP